jgi:hypothetical protein
MEMQTVLPWIIVGLPYDLLHAVGNFSLGILILPLVKLLKKITQKRNLIKYPQAGALGLFTVQILLIRIFMITLMQLRKIILT